MKDISMSSHHIGYKPFDENLCDSNDKLAKEIAIDYLESTGKYELFVSLDMQPEKYKKWDFEIFQVLDDAGEMIDPIPIKVEVERKNCWKKSGKWETPRWKTIDVPSRKNKTESDIFIMTNHGGDTLWVLPTSKILSSPISYKSTINYDSSQSTGNEGFFAVSLSSAMMYHKKNNTWVKVKDIIYGDTKKDEWGLWDL